MSTDDRDVPEFDDFDLPDEMFEPGDETAQPTDDMIEATEEMAPLAEETIQPVDGTVAEDNDFGEAPTEDMMVPIAVGAEGIEAAVSSLDTDEEEEEERDKKEKEGLLKKLRNASPYTVMLGVSLAAILIAILCLWMELRTYNSDIKAEEAKQRVGAAPTVQVGSPRTTTAA